jgi:predicted SprT family Zn-dependent metalloprotease
MNELVNFCEELIKDYVPDFRLEVSNRLSRTLGYCQDSKKKIVLASKLLERGTQDQILEVVLHEIAHALTPQDKGHGIVWKRKAIELGVKPSYCTNFSVFDKKPFKYKVDCDEGHLGRKYRLRPNVSRKYCRSCGMETLGRLKVITL